MARRADPDRIDQAGPAAIRKMWPMPVSWLDDGRIIALLDGDAQMVIAERP